MEMTLKAGDRVLHASGKLYEIVPTLDGFVMRGSGRPDRVAVIGLRAGKYFGPVRFVNESDLTILDAQETR